MKIVKYIEYSEETLNSKFSPKKICESTEANFKLAWHLPFKLDGWHQWHFKNNVKLSLTNLLEENFTFLVMDSIKYCVRFRYFKSF